MAAFGVHLGSSNSCLTVYKDGNTEVIANAAGDRTTPALVAFSDHDKVVGLPAKQGMIRNAKNTVCHAKRLLGRSFSEPEVQKEIAGSQCKIVDKDGCPMYQVQYLESQKLFSPEQCATFIFESLRDIAKHHGDAGVHDAVLSIPHHFTEIQRLAVSSAAEKAGFNVLRFIHEPTSALLAYDLGMNHHHEQINGVVVRMGGSSCSVSCFTIINGMYRFLSDSHTNELGGDMFTELLADQFAKDFQRQYKVDPKENRRSWNKLLSAAEQCKHTLTSLPNAHCSVDSLHEGIDYSGNMARGRMDILSTNLLAKLQDLIEESVLSSGLAKVEIQKVVLAGGATKSQCVVKRIQNHFSNAELCSSISADEVIAVGAAKQAGIILSNCDNSDTSPSASGTSLQLSISVIVQGCEPEVLFVAEHPLPAKTKRTFCSKQPSLRLVVTQGDDHTAPLAKLILKDVGEGSITDAQFSIDSEGALHIVCINEKTNAMSELVVPVSRESSSSPRS